MALFFRPAASTSSLSFSAVTSTTAATTASPFIFSVEDHDSDNAYNAATGVFTVPAGKGGVYFFTWIVFCGVTATNIDIYINGTKAAQGTTTISNASTGVGSAIATLAAGDTVDVRPGGNATASGGSALNRFAGLKYS